MSGPAPPSIAAAALAWRSFWLMVSNRTDTPVSCSNALAFSRVRSSAGGMKLFHATWWTSRFWAKAGATPPNRPSPAPAVTAAADFVNSRRVSPCLRVAPAAGFFCIFIAPSSVVVPRFPVMEPFGPPSGGARTAAAV